MARHKKVTDDDALRAAINLFWQQGYHAVGTREIEAQTGITRFTLQKTYGGKKALFLHALDCYLDLTDKYLLAPIAHGTLENLAQWFEEAAQPEGFEASANSGCLMVNTITAFDSQDADIARRAQRYFDMLDTAFGSAINKAASQGDLRMVVDPEQCKQLAVANAIALQVATAAGGPYANQIRLAAAKLVRSWAA